MKTNIKAQLKNKIKIQMFKMARDPFDISPLDGTEISIWELNYEV